jgi:hypothetical protein
MEQAADNAMALALEVEKLVGGLSPMNLGTVAHLYFEEILRTDLAKDLQDWFGSEFSVYPEWSLPNNGAFVGRDILSGMLNLQQAIEKGTIRPDVIVTRIVNGVEEAFAVFDLKTGNADIRTRWRSAVSIGLGIAQDLIETISPAISATPATPIPPAQTTGAP